MAVRLESASLLKDSTAASFNTFCLASNLQATWLFVCFLELSPKERIKMMMFAFDMKFNQSAKFAWKLMRWLRSVLWWNLQRVHQPLVCMFSRWWTGVTTDFYSKVRTAMMIKTCGFHVFTNIFGMKCPFSALHCVPQELHSQDFLGGKLLYYCDFACADHGGTTRSEKTEFAQQPLVVVTWTVQRVHQTAVEDPGSSSCLRLPWGGTVRKDALISSWCTKLNFLNPFLSKTALLSPISIQSHLLQCGIDFRS